MGIVASLALIDDVTEVLGTRRTAPTERVIVQPAEPRWTTRLQAYVDPATEILGQSRVHVHPHRVHVDPQVEDLRNLRDSVLSEAARSRRPQRPSMMRPNESAATLFAQLMLNTGFGVVITLVLLIMGVKYALLWGFIATVMRYVRTCGHLDWADSPRVVLVGLAPESEAVDGAADRRPRPVHRSRTGLQQHSWNRCSTAKAWDCPKAAQLQFGGDLGVPLGTSRVDSLRSVDGVPVRVGPPRHSVRFLVVLLGDQPPL